MSRPTQELMQLAVDYGNALVKPKDVELIVIVFDPANGSTGWGSTIQMDDSLSVISDVLDDIICQRGGTL